MGKTAGLLFLNHTNNKAVPQQDKRSTCSGTHAARNQRTG
jgi:hypothetical protein